MTEQPTENEPTTREMVASAYLPSGEPVDNVGIVRVTIKNPLTGQDQEVTAAATVPGVSAVTRTLSPQPPQAPEPQANLIERYLNSAVYHRHGPAIGRGPTDLGLIGKGHTVLGDMLLMDVDSGEVHRVLPGTRIDEDRVYINTRNLPEWLAENPRLARGGGT